MVQVIIGINFDFDLDFIQDEIKFCFDEIDCVFGQIQFNGVNVLFKDGLMKIQVGVNDGEIIMIDLKKIDFFILKLISFNVNGKGVVDNVKVIEVDLIVVGFF